MSDSFHSSPTLTRVTLEIIGRPGEPVAIYAETTLDTPPPPIFEGTLTAMGFLRLRVPRTPLLLVVGAHDSQSLEFAEDETFKTVDVRPRG